MTTDSTVTFPEYAAQLCSFIRQTMAARTTGTPLPDENFDALARSLFALQFDLNTPYRQFCQSRKITPQNLGHWSRIPAVPAAAFKELELTSLPAAQRTRVFHSSGTTDQRPSRHFHSADSLAIYEASLLPWFAKHLLPHANASRSFASIRGEGARRADGGARHKFYCHFLTPSPHDAPHSSLVHMFETIQREFAASRSRFTGAIGSDGAWTLNVDATIETLREAIADKHPILLLGTAFSFVHLLDGLKEAGIRLQLPPGSRVMETGGYKGRSRAMPKAELHALITDFLGLPDMNIVCEYGMSELSSQAYDCAAGDAATRVFQFPPWARVQIISPETGAEVGGGEIGLIRIFDLANVHSVMAIQTEDLGVRCGSGFELLGRAALSEPRGCSLQSI